MKIEELLKSLKDLKTEDRELQKKLDLISEGAEAVKNTFDDQFGELKKTKESLQGIKKAFELEDGIKTSEISEKVKAKYDEVVREKETIGQSADDHTKSLAKMQNEFEQLQKDFRQSQEDIQLKEQKLKDKDLSESIRNEYKGDTELYTFAEPKIKELISQNPEAEVSGVITKFLEDNPRFQLPEQNLGPGGEPPKPKGKSEENYTLLDTMKDVSAANKG